MDPPIAALAAASMLYEPQSAVPVNDPASVSASSVDHLLLFDDFEHDDSDAFPPLETAASGLSVSAHETLMAFLTEMEALDERDNGKQNDEQQSNGGNSSDASTGESVPETVTESNGDCQQRPGDNLTGVAEEKQKAEDNTSKQPATTTRQGRRKTTRTVGPSARKPEKKRIRAKQEIDMLREDTAALQRRLELMQSTTTEKQKQEAENEASLAETSAAASQVKKPKLRHVSAVEQNRQLRKLVKTQLRYAKQLKSVLMNKNHDNEVHSILISDNAVTQTPLSKADLVVFYEALTGKLDTLYTQLDSVFADANLRDSQQFSDVKLVIDDNKYATLQLRDVKTLPFSFATMKDVSWRFLKAQSVKHGDGADEFLVADDDVMLIRRALTVQLNKGEPEVEIPTRSVNKRFMSKDRMVFCWDGTTDWPAPPQASHPDQSISLREKGWAVIKPVPGNPGLSTTQICILLTPRVADERVYTQATRQEIEEGMAKFVIPTYQQFLVSQYQMIENMLLDEQKQ